MALTWPIVGEEAVPDVEQPSHGNHHDAPKSSVGESEGSPAQEAAVIPEAGQKPATLLKRLSETAEDKPWIAWPILAITGLLAIGGAVDAIMKIGNGLSTFAGTPLPLSVAAIASREVTNGNKPVGMTQEELQLNGLYFDPQHWDTFVDITLQNNSDFPIVVMRSDITILQSWKLLPTGRLLGILEPTGIYDVTLPTNSKPSVVTVSDMNFGIAPKTSEVLSFRVQADNPNQPSVFLLKATLEYAFNGGEETAVSNSTLAFVQGGAEFVQVFGNIQQDTPRERVVEAMGYVTESWNEVFLSCTHNASVFSELRMSDDPLKGKLSDAVDFNEMLLSIFSPSVAWGEKFDVQRDSFEGESGIWKVYMHGDDFRNYPLVRLKSNETDTYASGWRFDELNGLLEKDNGTRAVILDGSGDLFSITRK